MRRVALLPVLVVLFCGVATAPASAAGVPSIAGYFKPNFKGFGALTNEYTFGPCRGCAAIVYVTDPVRQGAAHRVRMTRRGGYFVGVYRSNSYCGYRWVIRFRPRRTRTVEGQRFALTGSGTVSSRGKGCNPKSKTDGFSGTLRFKAKRVSVLRVVDAVVSADELGDGCNPYPYRFSAGADSFPDNYHREGYSWRWDFGAGVTSTEAKPRHTFPRSGRQAVSVSVRMTDGSVAKTTHLVDVAEPVEGC